MRERASNDSAPIYRTGRGRQSLFPLQIFFPNKPIFSGKPNWTAEPSESFWNGHNGRRQRQKHGTWIEISTDSWEIKNDACTLIISSTMWTVLGASLITLYYNVRATRRVKEMGSVFLRRRRAVLYRMWKDSLGVERSAHTRTHTHRTTLAIHADPQERPRDFNWVSSASASSTARSLLSTPSSSRRETSN